MSIVKRAYVNNVPLSNLEEFSNLSPTQPPGESRLWRYINFAKLVSLLDTRTLFLSRADRLGDPFEGSLSRLSNERLRKWEEQTGKPGAAAYLSQLMRLQQERVFVNCWHELDNESDAMWTKYAGEDGVAIMTTYSSLLDSLDFISEEDKNNTRMGRVHYVDYDSDYVPEFNGMSFFHKRKSFSHEHEVRLAKWIDWETDDVGNVVRDDGKMPLGLQLTVDINVLIHRVVVSPVADRWILELAKSIAKSYNLSVEIEYSRMATSPSWGNS